MEDCRDYCRALFYNEMFELLIKEIKNTRKKIEGGIYKKICTIFASRYKNEEQEGETNDGLRRS